MAEQITVYTTGPGCNKCRMTKIMLDAKHITYIEVDVTKEENAAARDYITEELGYTVAPVVVVNDDDHWCDVRPDHIDRIAKRAILPSDAT